MKAKLNSVFRKFGFEVHGIGAIEKISRTSFKNDSTAVQKKLTKSSKPVIFDVGANKGQSVELYKRNFTNSIIHSFEPFIESFTQLQKVSTSFQHVYANQLALSNENGERSFYINSNADTSSFLESKKIGASSDDYVKTKEIIKVRTQKLDDYCEKNKIQKIDILKLDVQGGEMDVLKGSSKMLNEGNIKVIFSEVYFKQQYIDQPLFHDLSKFLSGFNYELVDLYNLYYNSEQLLWGDAIFILK